jgi:hypothetical protein
VRRTFVLRRDEDVSGVSGTGVVAEGAVFSDGTVVVRWLGKHASTTVWPSIDSLTAINGHGGKTQVVYDE